MIPNFLRYKVEVEKIRGRNAASLHLCKSALYQMKHRGIPADQALKNAMGRGLPPAVTPGPAFVGLRGVAERFAARAKAQAEKIEGLAIRSRKVQQLAERVEKRAADAAEICTRTADVLEGKFSPNAGKLVATAERRPFPARSRG